MEKSLQVLRDNGGTMSFDEFMQVARDNRERGELWLRLRHTGQLETFIENGQHLVRLPADNIPF